MSVCVYSPGQHDSEQHSEVVTHQIPPKDVTPIRVPKFTDADHPLCFVIVCHKLLTGFDAPNEQPRGPCVDKTHPTTKNTRRKRRVSLHIKKWRRRESNPRPKLLSISVYMLILWLTTPSKTQRPFSQWRGSDLKRLFIVPRADAAPLSGLSKSYMPSRGPWNTIRPDSSTGF